MSQESPTRIRLFPLGLVLLPEELLPLHIFEERYKRLIADCRATGEAFGVIWERDGELAAAGCTARLVRVLEEFPDGRSNIVVQGADRFKVIETHDPEEPSLDALEASVEFLEDAGAPPDEALVEEAERLYRRLLELTGNEEQEEPDSVPSSAYAIAGRLDFEPALEQRLLELDEESERLRLLNGVLRMVVERLQLLEERQEAIRGNGKVD